ncbi:transient receptor potential cation channel subfamily M member 4a isoform X1 [Ictalurus punctatus]|uniref:Transient receptor potential cation channel subfamily M member 4a isoform X1 n=1 Tax=Ictalurus punctatus TaxID=7998 RepID=A0A9F7TGW9_ICTPU|nr:transient receptor potential cation channel subfamily M member 4a isoform X1 [Ictalurus punctatus]
MNPAGKENEVLRDGSRTAERDQGWIPKVIKKRVCTTFVEDPLSNGDQCQCGGDRARHGSIATGDYFGSAIVTQWDSSKHTSECPPDAFGELKFAGIAHRQSNFLRLSCDTPSSLVYAILTQHWGLPPPNLVVSLVGGVGQEKVRSWVRDVVRQGLVRAAQSTGAWLITGGLREGVGRCVGEAVRDHGAAAASQSKLVALGVTPWGLVENRQQLVKAEGSFPARYYVQNTSQDSCFLDSNYQAFLLVDDGSAGRRGGETSFITNLEKFISHQRTGIWGSGNIEIPVLCMLISGDASVLKRMDMSLKKATPWLVLNGSGPAADMITELLNDLSRSASPVDEEGKDGSNPELRDRVREIIKRYFPSEKTLEKLVDQALSISQKRSLITVFHGEQDGPDDFDTVILRALVRASKQVNSSSSEYTEELKLAVAWNRVDIAKSELFNGDIQWKYDDLEDSMTDALVNDKPQFVRLFTENGLNILQYLTYERLEMLYQSLCSNTLAYTLLQTWLRERHNPASSQTCSPDSADGNCKDLKSPMTGPSSASGLSLFEVSRLLGVILGGICQPFYYLPLGLEPGASSRKAAKHVNKILQGDCAYRHQQVAFPWSSLFIWAVLQNRSEMAMFFWEMAGESVMSALSACKILRELSKLESETETCLSMKELAQKFENLAHDMFSACYQSNETRSLTLLIRMSPFWGRATCLQMATVADARLFFSHDGVQTLLAQIWWGDMHSRTEVWKLIMTFFLPPLIYTDLITFREDHADGLEGSNTVAFSMADITQHMEDDGKVEDNSHVVDGNDDGGHVCSLADITHTEEDMEECTALTRDQKRKPASPHKHPYIVHRWRQFWFAPVTSFLGNVLMYFLFLILFAYILLVEFRPPPPIGPAPIEYLLYFWVFTLVCEEIRQSFVCGSGSFSQSMRLYIQDLWNKCDLTAILLFILGLTCRMFDWSYEFGRSMLCVDYMVFTLRLIHIFAVNKHLGPKIIIVGKMVKDVFFFLFFLGVWLLAYGVANQALIYAYDPRPYWVIRRVFYRPYLHIFGQIPLDEIDAHRRIEKVCTNNMTLIQQGAEPCPQSEANWLVLILLSIYLLVTNVLLLNLLIAMFSYTFSKVQEHSDVHWKFQRYNLIVEYHSRPCLAPPFIILSHLRLFIKRTIRKVPSVKIKHFMLDLRDRKASRLNTWEAVQKENLLSTLNKKLRDSDTERLRRTSSKVDNMLKQMAEIRDQDRRLRTLESELEYCSNSLSWIMEELAQSDLIKHTRRPPVQRVSDTATPTSRK